MDKYGRYDRSFSTDVVRQQKALLAQLFKVAQNMVQIEQLLQWLADNIVQRFNIQLIQFWTNQIDATGMSGLQLRIQVRQDSSLPQHIVANNDLMLLAQRMTGEKRIYEAQPVERLFSAYRVTLLKRYRLNYCVGSSIDAPALLPPTSGQGGIASPFAMTTLILAYKEPQSDLMPNIAVIVNQAIIVAGNRGMLLPTAPVQQATAVRPLQQETLPLTELIPRRRQDTDIVLLNNPFSNSVVIADKQARRLYAAMGGGADIAALCRKTEMSVKEVYTALRFLLNQKRIDLYTPNGQLVDVDLLPDSL